MFINIHCLCALIAIFFLTIPINATSLSYFSGNWNGKEIGGSNSNATLHVVADTFSFVETYGSYTYTLKEVILNDSQAYQIVIATTYPHFTPGDTLYSFFKEVAADSFMTATNAPAYKYFPSNFTPSMGKRVFEFKKTTTSIEQMGVYATSIFHICVSPNPASSIIWFTSNLGYDVQWYVYNMLGQTVVRLTGTPASWDCRTQEGMAVSKGQYIIKAVSRNSSTTRTISIK